MALAIAIFGAGMGIERSVEHDKQVTEATMEVLKHEGLPLENLAMKFQIEQQVPGGEKTILHIGQTHLPGRLIETTSPTELKRVITSQKNIEKLLLYLKEKGVTDTVYVEGQTPEEKRGDLDEVKTHVTENRAKFQNDVLASSLEMANSSSDDDGPGMRDVLGEGIVAQTLYSDKCELEREYLKIKGEYQNFQKTGHADEQYQKTFEKHAKDNIPQLIENIKLQAEKLGEDELIRGDNIYAWGAAEKLYAEGKINLLPAEDQAARDKTDAPFSFKERIASIPDKEYKPEYRHRLREDAALGIINQDKSTQRVIPLIYGSGHNFTEAVDGFNHKAASAKFGLVKLTPDEHEVK